MELSFSTFNFNFKEDKFFDINKTISHMGLLTETARLHPKSERTGHPMYSFVLLVKNQINLKLLIIKALMVKTLHLI